MTVYLEGIKRLQCLPKQKHPRRGVFVRTLYSVRYQVLTQETARLLVLAKLVSEDRVSVVVVEVELVEAHSIVVLSRGEANTDQVQAVVAVAGGVNRGVRAGNREGDASRFAILKGVLVYAVVRNRSGLVNFGDRSREKGCSSCTVGKWFTGLILRVKYGAVRGREGCRKCIAFHKVSVSVVDVCLDDNGHLVALVDSYIDIVEGNSCARSTDNCCGTSF